ncbi:hypothetical protein ACFQ08_05170 [Streptosporangium algeriense]|uniref:Uncharacterized protein n=1 Tax=Streptosporangium algeriense TaxID=1682748 RepID=A0ABW3DLW5_9ACTN
MADIGYFEAWQMWLDGRSTLGNDLFGLPMIWWGRAGKIAAFVSGMTILLDIAGTERLVSFADRLHAVVQAFWSRALTYSFSIGAFVLAFAWVAIWDNVWSIELPVPAGLPGLGVLVGLLKAVVVAALLCLAPLAVAGTILLIDKVCTRLPTIFTHPRAVHLRVVAAVLLVAGFHFDLLAS